MSSTRDTESVRRGVWVVSVLFAVLALAQAGQPSVVEETDMMNTSDIYNEGPLKVDLYTVYSTGLSKLGHRKSRDSESNKHASFAEIKLAQEPPRPLLIATPDEAGEYPVIVFQHGFSLKNTFYSQLLKHVASYGFIAVAPQVHHQFCFVALLDGCRYTFWLLRDANLNFSFIFDQLSSLPSFLCCDFLSES